MTASAELYTPPIARVAPTSGPPGQMVTVSGRGFYAGEVIQLSDDFVNIGRVTTTSTGIFVVHVRIPSNASAGANTIYAYGERSGATAATSFTVT